MTLKCIHVDIKVNTTDKEKSYKQAPPSTFYVNVDNGTENHNVDYVSRKH